jgi:hypothetical protein
VDSPLYSTSHHHTPPSTTAHQIVTFLGCASVNTTSQVPLPERKYLRRVALGQKVESANVHGLRDHGQRVGDVFAFQAE